MASPQQPQLFLHDHPLSSYAQKIRIALREKHIPFDRATPPGLGAGKSVGPLDVINPRKEVPALEDGELKLFDSSVIFGYIEDKYPGHPLLPTGARQRAEARMIEEVCDTAYEAINWAHGEVVWMGRAEGEAAEKLLSQVAKQAGVVQGWLEERLGGREWFNGNRFGYADVCAAPMVNRAIGNGYGPVEGSRLRQWYERIKGREAVKETFAEGEEAAKKMSGLGDVFRSGGARREYRDHRLEVMIKSGGIDVVLEGLRRDNIRFSWPEPAKL